MGGACTELVEAGLGMRSKRIKQTNQSFFSIKNPLFTLPNPPEINYI